MRSVLLSALLLATAARAAVSQPHHPSPPRASIFRFAGGDPERAVLGVSTTSDGKRDTLGVLVNSVTEGSPAEKAGIEEGNRIGSINGVSLKLARDDAGDEYMSGTMRRRLEREMRKVKAGDEATLEVWTGGRYKTVKVKTVAADDLRSMRRDRASEDDRAALGLSVYSTNRKRDTLGVFVSSVTEDGPAEKAGIVEGDRIASINGVDVRAPREDAGDAWTSSGRVHRLNREIGKLKAGQTAELVVISGGRTRTVKVTAARARDVRERGGNHFLRFGDGVDELNFDGLHESLRTIVPEIQLQLDHELPRAMNEIRREMRRIPMEMPMYRARLWRGVII